MLKVIGASWFQTRVSTFIVGAVSALGILAIIMGEIDKEEDDGVYSATVFWSETAGFRIDFWGQGNEMEEIPYGVGRAYYKQEIDTTGWAMLEIETCDKYPDWVQAFSAGLLEGSLTWQLIYWHWQNTVQDVCKDQMQFCNYVRSFIEINSENIQLLAEKSGDSDPFWHQVQLFYVQLDGLETGWRYGVKRSRLEINIPPRDFLSFKSVARGQPHQSPFSTSYAPVLVVVNTRLMNMMTDLAALEHVFNSSVEDPKFPFIFSTAASFSTAFVRFLADTGELYAAHNSGGLLQSMLRVMKRYQFGYHHTSDTNSDPVPGQIITFSSYPGVIHSQDDFYLVADQPEFGKRKHQLAVLGTAFHSYNRPSVGSLNQKEQVVIGPRVMAANRLAQNGYLWGHYLAKANSCTASKQWLIINYGQTASLGAPTAPPMDKKLASQLLSSLPSKMQAIEKKTKVPISAKKGLLWVVEQMSGFTHCSDHTSILQRTGFWVSNGLPHYQGTDYTSRWTGTGSKSHAQAAYSGLVDASNLTSVMHLMRNITFLLNSHLVPPNNNSSSSLNLPPMGTIDSKILMISSFQKIVLKVVSGPLINYDQNNKNDSCENIRFQDAPFQWSKSQFANKTHIGLPDCWKFEAVQPKWFWV